MPVPVRQRFLWAVPLGALVLLLGGCGQTPAVDPHDQALLERASNAAAGVNEIEGVLSETSTELSQLQTRVDSLDQGVARFVESADAHALGRAGDIPDPPEGSLALRLSFAYSPEPLPGEGLQVFEPSEEVDTVWAMESLPKGQPVPVGDPIESNTLFFEPGEARTVTLVYRNPSGEEVGFLVLPHQESPGNLAEYIWPTCLCMSFVYRAPAQGSWYRVIKIAVGPDAPAGAKVDALWPVLTDPSVFPQE